MALSAKGLQSLNYSSEVNTDQVIFSKATAETWDTSTSEITYNSNLGDSCLPIAQYSLDNQIWYNQGEFDTTQTWAFPISYSTDDGIIHLPFHSTPTPTTVYIRLVCLAKPDQKPFQQTTIGPAIIYKSEFNYMKIVTSGVIDTGATGVPEPNIVKDIPHNLGYQPFYLMFVRINSSGTPQTMLMTTTNSIRGRIGVTDSVLHFDNFLSNPLVTNAASRYYYFIYYD